jgi:glycosyltransferase involved in cell wall biosynthesis
MDLDYFGYPFIAGRSLLNPTQRQRLIEGIHEEARQRVENMLYACCHPSCRTVFFFTKTARQSAEAHISAYGFEGFRKDFLAKSRVLYPAQAAMAKEKILAKWEALESGRVPITVLFCGRDFDIKNGSLALEVFDRLLERHPQTRIIYVGQMSADLQKSWAKILSKIEFHCDLPRDDILDLLQESHVLLHPSRNESH